MSEAPEREALEKAFRVALPEGAEVRQRKKFDCPGAFLGEHMFALLYKGQVVLRLDESDRQALLAFADAVPFEVNGERLREYVVVPEDMSKARDELRAWMAKAAQYVATLPPAEAPEVPIPVVPLKRTRAAIHRSLSGEQQQPAPDEKKPKKKAPRKKR